MNLQQLRYLVALADRGTMTAAAAELHVSQPALSRAIRDLERELGATLFERAGRTVVATADADAVLEHARVVVERVDAIRASARTVAGPPLSLCTTSSLELLLTRDVMPTYVRRVDHAVRMVRADGTAAIEDRVVAGDAEIGFTDRRPAGALTVTPFVEEDVVLVSPPGVDLPDPVSLDALDGMRLILPAPGSSRRREYADFFASLGVRPVVALETDERSSWTTAVLANVGSVLWFADNAEDAARQGAVARRFRPAMSRTLSFVHRDGELSGAGASFLDVVRELATVTPASR
ncbi:MAG TPA: LysR family transcriptional regulator [Acidimicrobiia bacterium]|nr:LysR family transcriptional regulator [Acidimicrobiia bacterium]